MTNLFYENINTPETTEFIASHAEVRADSDGYFITVETDSCEGVAHLTLPCAVKVRAALGKAIKAAKEHRKEK